MTNSPGYAVVGVRRGDGWGRGKGETIKTAIEELDKGHDGGNRVDLSKKRKAPGD